MDAGGKDDETRALGFAALALVRATIDTLERKGLLDGDDVQSVFDGALTSLEFRHQDKAIDLARRIVEGTAISRGVDWSQDPPPT